MPFFGIIIAHFSANVFKRLLVILAVFSALPALAQTGEDVTPPIGGGFDIYDASIFSSFFSSGYGTGVGSTSNVAPTGVNLSADVAVGGSVTGGWARPRPRSNFSVVYSVSYTGRIRYSNWDALNQSLSITGSHKLGRKWVADLSVVGRETNLEQFLFEPTVFSQVASVPATFDELAAAALTGQSTNAEIAAILTGAPLEMSPAQTLLYGNRSLTASMAGSLRYAHSSRTSLSISVVGTLFKNLPANESSLPANYAPILIHGTTANVSAQLSHSLTPRTQVSITATTGRIVSGLQDSYNNSVSGSFGRTMNRHWFVSLQGGAGTLRIVRTTFPTPAGPQITAAGSAGYKTFAHTFLASFGRTISDAYGLGATTTMNATGSWRWFRPGNSWGLHSSYTWQQFEGGIVNGLNTWSVNGGLDRKLSSRLVVQGQYVYLKYAGRFNGLNYDQPIQAVQLALDWNPTGIGRSASTRSAAAGR